FRLPAIVSPFLGHHSSLAGGPGFGVHYTPHFPFFCSKSQSSTSVSLYVGVHASWPTPLYSVYFGSPPAFLIAAIMSRGRSTGTSGSASPWKAQIGSLASFSACAGSPPPHTGIAAANSSGLREIRSQVP